MKTVAVTLLAIDQDSLPRQAFALPKWACKVWHLLRKIGCLPTPPILVKSFAQVPKQEQQHPEAAVCIGVIRSDGDGLPIGDEGLVESAEML